MVKTENFIQVEVTSATALRTWLTRHHTQKESVWLVTYKKLQKQPQQETNEYKRLHCWQMKERN